MILPLLPSGLPRCNLGDLFRTQTQRTRVRTPHKTRLNQVSMDEFALQKWNGFHLGNCDDSSDDMTYDDHPKCKFSMVNKKKIKKDSYESCHNSSARTRETSGWKQRYRQRLDALSIQHPGISKGEDWVSTLMRGNTVTTAHGIIAASLPELLQCSTCFR